MVGKSGRESPVPKPFKGVRRRSWGVWVTEIRLPKTRRRLWLGSYSTPEQAAKAYDVALLCLRGPSASLNYPDSPPPHAPFGLPDREIQELAAQTAADFPPPSPTLLPSYSSPSHSDDLSSPASSGECFPEDDQSSPALRGFQTPAQHSDSGVESTPASTSRHEPCTSPSPIHDFTLRSPCVGSSSAQPALETAPNASGVSSASSETSAENVFQFPGWDFLDCGFDHPPLLSDLWSGEQITTYKSIVPVDKPEDDFGAFCEPYLWSS